MRKQARSLRVFNFIQDNGGQFRVSVFARNLSQARAFVKMEAIGSIIHRTLRFAFEGVPPDAERWCAAHPKLVSFPDAR
jgi:hypothetical protein